MFLQAALQPQSEGCWSSGVPHHKQIYLLQSDQAEISPPRTGFVTFPIFQLPHIYNTKEIIVMYKLTMGQPKRNSVRT